MLRYPFGTSHITNHCTVAQDAPGAAPRPIACLAWNPSTKAQQILATAGAAGSVAVVDLRKQKRIMDLSDNQGCAEHGPCAHWACPALRSLVMTCPRCRGMPDQRGCAPPGLQHLPEQAGRCPHTLCSRAGMPARMPGTLARKQA